MDTRLRGLGRFVNLSLAASALLMADERQDQLLGASRLVEVKIPYTRTPSHKEKYRTVEIPITCIYESEWLITDTALPFSDSPDIHVMFDCGQSLMLHPGGNITWMQCGAWFDTSNRVIIEDDLGREIALEHELLVMTSRASFGFCLQTYDFENRLFHRALLHNEKIMGRPSRLSYDAVGRRFVVSDRHRIYAVPMADWLLSGWTPAGHAGMPAGLRAIVFTLTMLRSIAVWSTYSLFPNEMLFELFQLL